MLSNIKCQTSELTNTIYIGRVNKAEDQFLEKEDRTDEVIEAVRDHLVGEIKGGENSAGYKWKRKDGKTVRLTVEILESE